MRKTAVVIGLAMLFAGQAWGEASIESQYGPGATAEKAPNPIAGESPADYFGLQRSFSSLDSFAMVPNSNGFQTLRSSTSGLFCSGGTDSRAVGQVQVPHGVRMELLRAWGFDSSATDNMSVKLQQTCLPDFGALVPTPATLTSLSSTGSGGAWSDSAFFTDTIADNESCTYQVVVQLGNTTGTCNTSQGYYKSRVQWFRVTPPGPAVATFTDVPTSHPFYNQISALARTGITGGCTATTYCPNDNLTRGQMAAFLARALGLPLNEGIPDPVNP